MRVTGTHCVKLFLWFIRFGWSFLGLLRVYLAKAQASVSSHEFLNIIGVFSSTTSDLADMVIILEESGRTGNFHSR